MPRFAVLVRRADHRSVHTFVLEADDIDQAAAHAVEGCVESWFVAGVVECETPIECVEMLGRAAQS